MTTVPCGDSNDCKATLETLISTANNHQQHQHNSESCTPFCTCTCCAVPVINLSTTRTSILKVQFQSNKYPLYTEAFTSIIFSSIWQPPQLS